MVAPTSTATRDKLPFRNPSKTGQVILEPFPGAQAKCHARLDHGLDPVQPEISEIFRGFAPCGQQPDIIEHRQAERLDAARALTSVQAEVGQVQDASIANRPLYRTAPFIRKLVGLALPCDGQRRIGGLVDTEFRLKRDAFEANCSEVEALETWRAGRAYESVWNRRRISTRPCFANPSTPLTTSCGLACWLKSKKTVGRVPTTQNRTKEGRHAEVSVTPSLNLADSEWQDLIKPT